jgi:hypothetical protein
MNLVNKGPYQWVDGFGLKNRASRFPPTLTDTNAAASTGTFAFYDKCRLFHVGAIGTKDDLATSAQVGSVVLQHLRQSESAPRVGFNVA